MANKVKLQSKNGSEEVDVKLWDVLEGGVLMLESEDKHGTRTTRLLSPQTWEEIEVK